MSLPVQVREEKNQNVIAKEVIAWKIIVNVIAQEELVPLLATAFNAKIKLLPLLKIKREGSIYKSHNGVEKNLVNKMCSLIDFKNYLEVKYPLFNKKKRI